MSLSKLELNLDKSGSEVQHIKLDSFQNEHLNNPLPSTEKVKKLDVLFHAAFFTDHLTNFCKNSFDQFERQHLMIDSTVFAAKCSCKQLVGFSKSCLISSNTSYNAFNMHSCMVYHQP